MITACRAAKEPYVTPGAIDSCNLSPSKSIAYLYSAFHLLQSSSKYSTRLAGGVKSTPYMYNIIIVNCINSLYKLINACCSCGYMMIAQAVRLDGKLVYGFTESIHRSIESTRHLESHWSLWSRGHSRPRSRGLPSHDLGSSIRSYASLVVIRFRNFYRLSAEGTLCVEV